jgi:hypothetical protein
MLGLSIAPSVLRLEQVLATKSLNGKDASQLREQQK